MAQTEISMIAHTFVEGLCTGCGELDLNDTVAIYFRNDWYWSDVRVHYWNGASENDWPGDAMTWVANDSTYDYYKFDLPTAVAGFMFTDASQIVDGDVANDKKTPDILDVKENEMYYMFYEESAENKYQVRSENYSDYCAKFNVISLDPTESWNKDNARFAIYAFVDENNEFWANLSDNDGDGVYSGWIPTEYTNIVFCRMNGATTENNWENKWDQTVDVELTEGRVYTIVEPYGVTDQNYAIGVWENERVVYLSPNSNWIQDDARFAVYYFNGDNTDWTDMISMKDSNNYIAVIPNNYSNVIFCRMNPSTSANNWDNKWNQTGDLSIPNDGKNLFTVPAGSWDGATNSWSTK